MNKGKLSLIKEGLHFSKRNYNFNGFEIRKGFALLFENYTIKAISSGHHDDDGCYVYRQDENDNWVGGWESDDTFPFTKLKALIKERYREESYGKAVKAMQQLINSGELPVCSNETITFVDVVAGDKQNDGGEYGFYSSYYPTDVDGVFAFETSTTCTFDSCGTGFEGYVPLTQSLLNKLIKDEEETLRIGSLY